jgi:hypothetical protein
VFIISCRDGPPDRPLRKFHVIFKIEFFYSKKYKIIVKYALCKICLYTIKQLSIQCFFETIRDHFSLEEMLIVTGKVQNGQA